MPALISIAFPRGLVDERVEEVLLLGRAREGGGTIELTSMSATVVQVLLATS
jgi:hypothetical protein